MKRTVFLLIALLLLTTLGALVVAKRPGKTGCPQGCQVRLHQYIDFAFLPGSTSVQMAQRAGKPENLLKDSGYTVFGDSVYYQTDIGPGSNPQGGAMPLPYPPKELWCILLEQQSEQAGETSNAIAFAALHMDMYSADWMVHEGPSDLSTPGLLESLAVVGCDLGLDQAGPRFANHIEGD